MLRFGSLFAGIGGFDLGFENAKMSCAWQVEIDEQCLQLLQSKWAHVERREDVREIKGIELGSVDIISGGFPCQDVSVAGRRKGIAGERSGLWFEFHRILEETKPRWAIIENVPGLLSSNGGQDFAIVLRGLAQLGYGVTYRILDAQYFGVAQRRRRVFIIGSLGDWSSVEVLFESESLQRNFAQSQKAGKVAPAIPASGAGTARTGNERTEAEMMVVVPSILGSGPPASHRDDEGSLVVAQNLTRGNRNDPSSEDFVIAAPLRSRSSVSSNTLGRGGEDDENIVIELSNQSGVRRLTPVECERLQGFPDGWTEEFPDTTRYKMLGNAVCVNVAEWIGRRIMEHTQTN